MTDTITTTEKDRQIVSAECYVRSRFYPPLPVEYGRLAVEAVDAVNRDEPEATFDVSDLNPQPRGTDEDGMVTAAVLVEVLRLEHMIDQPCPDCLGSGYDDEVLAMPYTYGAEEATCETCDGSGMV